MSERENSPYADSLMAAVTHIEENFPITESSELVPMQTILSGSGGVTWKFVLLQGEERTFIYCATHPVRGRGVYSNWDAYIPDSDEVEGLPEWSWPASDMVVSR